MPVIFNESNKDEYEKKLLEIGLETIKQSGFKALRVEDITKKAGFAKTTFYTFFDSKGEFIHKIALHEREKAKQKYMQILDSNSKINRTKVKEFFEIQFLSDTNIYTYLSQDDYTYLKAQWPEIYALNPVTDEENTKWFLSKLDCTTQCDWKLFSNYAKAIVTVTMHPENLYKDNYADTIKLMIDGLLDYAFGKE